MRAPAGPALAMAPPLPINRPVPMVPPAAYEFQRAADRERLTGLRVPMAIICKCLDFNFLFSVGSCGDISFSTSEPFSVTLFSYPPTETGWMTSS